MITEWDGQQDRNCALTARMAVWFGFPSLAFFGVVIAFQALLFIESVQAHGLWPALVIAFHEWQEVFQAGHGPGL